jgi:hypothetical protein
MHWSAACGVILAEWRDEFSLQDLTGDGTITLEESQETASAERSPPVTCP